jgi:hypothetical protein
MSTPFVDDHRPGHDVLRETHAGVAVHAHRRALVHAGAVVAHVALDVDLDIRVDADRHRVPPARVHHVPTGVRRRVRIEVVQPLVQLAQRGDVEIDGLDRQVWRDGHQAGCLSQL